MDRAELAAGMAEAMGGPIATESQIERIRDRQNSAAPDMKMFQIDAVFQNGDIVPYAYAFTQNAASIISQKFREMYIYGQPKPKLKDFSVSPIRVSADKFS